MRRVIITIQDVAGVIERMRMQVAKRASVAKDSTELLRAIRGYSDDEPVSDDEFATR